MCSLLTNHLSMYHHDREQGLPALRAQPTRHFKQNAKTRIAASYVIEHRMCLWLVCHYIVTIIEGSNSRIARIITLDMKDLGSNHKILKRLYHLLDAFSSIVLANPLDQFTSLQDWLLTPLTGMYVRKGMQKGGKEESRRTHLMGAILFPLLRYNGITVDLRSRMMAHDYAKNDSLTDLLTRIQRACWPFPIGIPSSHLVTHVTAEFDLEAVDRDVIGSYEMFDNILVRSHMKDGVHDNTIPMNIMECTYVYRGMFRFWEVACIRRYIKHAMRIVPDWLTSHQDTRKRPSLRMSLRRSHNWHSNNCMCASSLEPIRGLTG